MTEPTIKEKVKDVNPDETKQQSVIDVHTTARAVRLLADGLSFASAWSGGYPMKGP